MGSALMASVAAGAAILLAWSQPAARLQAADRLARVDPVRLRRWGLAALSAVLGGAVGLAAGWWALPLGVGAGLAGYVAAGRLRSADHLARSRALAAAVPGLCDLLAVCLDGANEMWFKLSAVADVGALLAQCADLDWARLLDEAQRQGQRRSLLVGACLAEELLDADLPAAFRAAAADDPTARRLARSVAARLRTEAPRQDIVLRQTVFALRTRERLRDRWRFIRRLLCVPGAYEFTRWPWPRLQPFYALVRPLRLAWTVAVRGGRSIRLTVPAADAKLGPGGNNP